MKHDEDWALVVGLQSYKGLTDLKGPENDASDFHDWVTSDAPSGGGVPKAQAKLILSSQFPGPFKKVSDARPTAEQITRFFEDLDDTALDNKQANKGRRVGRRLYLYFAGHGIAPLAGDDDELEESALLMANATEGRFGRHVPGRRWLNWFHRAGYFRELVLLMDCCRDVYIRAPLHVPDLDKIINTRAMKSTKRFLAFATKWSSRSRERPIPVLGGKDRGVFTATLMKGLRGAASDASGNITAASLKSYLIRNYKEWLAPADLAIPDLLPEPEVEVPSNSDDLLFAQVPPAAIPTIPAFQVVIRITSDGLAGRTLEITDGRQVVASTVATPPRWTLPLLPGLYKIKTQGGGPEKFLEVGGTGEVHVEL
jgi:hypothetical protein